MQQAGDHIGVKADQTRDPVRRCRGVEDGECPGHGERVRAAALQAGEHGLAEAFSGHAFEGLHLVAVVLDERANKQLVAARCLMDLEGETARRLSSEVLREHFADPGHGQGGEADPAEVGLPDELDPVRGVHRPVVRRLREHEHGPGRAAAVAHAQQAVHRGLVGVVHVIDDDDQRCRPGHFEQCGGGSADGFQFALGADQLLDALGGEGHAVEQLSQNTEGSFTVGGRRGGRQKKGFMRRYSGR